MDELTVNLHMHTTYSDGTGTHKELGLAALHTIVDVLLVTDHNVLVKGIDNYYKDGVKCALVLGCEEIHDQSRIPQKNHLLVFGAGKELAMLADDHQNLFNEVHLLGGLSFIAHPIESAMPAFGETDISWVDWDITNFNGLEIWNGFSEFKSITNGKMDALAYGFFPEAIPHGPLPETLHLWDSFLLKGQRLVGIGGSDAHALHIPLGVFHKTVFPYEYHFSAINTHILTSNILMGNINEDRKMVFGALAKGHCFVGNDLPASTHGFRFSAQTQDSIVMMGDEISITEPVTLQIALPSIADIHLIMNGECIKKTIGKSLIHVTKDPGFYRVEVYKRRLGCPVGYFVIPFTLYKSNK
jgi:hypothetical protein